MKYINPQFIRWVLSITASLIILTSCIDKEEKWAYFYEYSPTIRLDSLTNFGEVRKAIQEYTCVKTFKGDYVKISFLSDEGEECSLPVLPHKCGAQDMLPRRRNFKFIKNINDTHFYPFKRFILNHGEDPELSENPQKAIISLELSPSMSIQEVERIFIRIRAHYLQLWEDESNRQFQLPLSKLKPDELQQILFTIPLCINALGRIY